MTDLYPWQGRLCVQYHISCADDWAETVEEYHVQNPHPQSFTVEEGPHDGH